MNFRLTPKRLAILALVLAVTGLPGAGMIFAGEKFHPILEAYFTLCMFLWLPLLLTSGLWGLARVRRDKAGTGLRGLTIITPARSLVVTALCLGLFLFVDVFVNELTSRLLSILMIISALLIPPTLLYGIFGLIMQWRNRRRE